MLVTAAWGQRSAVQTSTSAGPGMVFCSVCGVWPAGAQLYAFTVCFALCWRRLDSRLWVCAAKHVHPELWLGLRIAAVGCSHSALLCVCVCKYCVCMCVCCLWL